MKILVTGKNGFIARNVIEYFGKEHEILPISHTDSVQLLEKYCMECDFVFHLAAVQRSDDSFDFWKGNVDYTKKIITFLKNNTKNPSIIFSTSIGIDKPSLFATTKLRAEEILRNFCNNNGNKLYVFKLNHIFGRYGKPNFNNVIATFCYNACTNKPIVVSNPSIKLYFTYIDDLLNDFNKYLLLNKVIESKYISCSIQYRKSLGEILFIISKIMNDEQDNLDEFEKKMKFCFQSYIQQ